MLSYEKIKKNIIKDIEEIKTSSNLNYSQIRIMCPICNVKFWAHKRYKHFSSDGHQKKLNDYIINNEYDKNINKDIFRVDIDFW